MSIELKVPEIGESISEVEIGDWLKKSGEPVKKDDPLVTLESEKATVELPSPGAGTIGKVLKQKGDVAKVGEIIAYLEEGKADGSEKKPEPKSPETKASETKPAEKPAPKKSESKPESPELKAEEDLATPRLSQINPFQEKTRSERLREEPRSETAPPPAERRAPARQAPAQISNPPATSPPSPPRGGGENSPKPTARTEPANRDTTKDPASLSSPKGGEGRGEEALRVQGESRSEATTTQRKIESNRPEEVVPMSKLRRTVAERLVAAQHNAALLTTFNEIDMSSVMALRKEHGEAFQKKYNVKLGFMSFFVKAVIDGLKQFPAINAEIRGTDVVYHNYFDIGVAIGGGKGLVVPVLRDAERLSFAEIEMAIGDFGRRAQENKLKPDELQGGTFTVTNGGVYGSLLSTPIVNPPQSGVLGMHGIQDRPVAREAQVVIRPMMYVALTYDHRLVDGREAVTFLKRIKDTIENPARMLLEV
jgi:2-oxoglutarate dehydrogenase E2 component (dihydrolipoamide succinyltransferase)